MTLPIGYGRIGPKNKVEDKGKTYPILYHKGAIVDSSTNKGEAMLPFQTLDELIRWANERGMDVEEDNYGQLIIHTGLAAVSSHGDLAPFDPEEV